MPDPVVGTECFNLFDMWQIDDHFYKDSQSETTLHRPSVMERERKRLGIGKLQRSINESWYILVVHLCSDKHSVGVQTRWILDRVTGLPRRHVGADWHAELCASSLDSR